MKVVGIIATTLLILLVLYIAYMEFMKPKTVTNLNSTSGTVNPLPSPPKVTTTAPSLNPNITGRINTSY